MYEQLQIHSVQHTEVGPAFQLLACLSAACCWAPAALSVRSGSTIREHRLIKSAVSWCAGARTHIKSHRKASIIRLDNITAPQPFARPAQRGRPCYRIRRGAVGACTRACHGRVSATGGICRSWCVICALLMPFKDSHVRQPAACRRCSNAHAVAAKVRSYQPKDAVETSLLLRRR